MSSAGKKALREAARLETARVYGQLCREPVREPVDGRREVVHNGARVIAFPAVKGDQAC